MESRKHTEKGKKVITRVRVPGYVLIRMLPDETPVVLCVKPKALPASSVRPRNRRR
mgnify:CR=1 FL=1